VGVSPGPQQVKVLGFDVSTQALLFASK